jgi:hypothetical protein
VLLRLAALLLALVPAVASAGLRAVYVPKMGHSTEVKVADNGDIDAELGDGRRLVVRGGRSYLVTERLTGTIVNRLEDLKAVAGDRWAAVSRPGPPGAGATSLTALGPATVNGRTGTAYDWPQPAASGRPREPLVVLSDDPGLKPLAAAMRQVWRAQALTAIVGHPEWPAPAREAQAEMLGLLERGAPLKYGDAELETLERGEVRLEAFEPAEAVEPLGAFRARLERERRDDETQSDESDVSRAVFAEGRLWLVTDDGKLASLAEKESESRREELGAPVIDICAGPSGLAAVTGTRAGPQWTLWRRAGGTWRADRPVRRAQDSLVSLSCTRGQPVLLTTRRLIEAGRSAARLSNPLRVPVVNAVVHETGDHLFVGLNLGEWGGGLVRIERRTGRSIRIERNATGELCDGPLNTACDPVHGIATIPWKPSCVAVAVGLIHFGAHGRIAEVCGTRVESLFAQASDRRRKDSRTLADAAEGRYGSVAFFGLEAAGGALLAVGHDGLYRLDEAGRATHRPWPRFKEVGGLLVSFALPDAVLVLTTINRRASISGAAPILVVR